MGELHRSIGEVLALLRDEFPDVTISKIRFLESQGLVDPERTPSGYRRFYDKDIDRLRWILRQQRENYLPLKVIKGRLEGAEDETVDDTEPEAIVVAPVSRLETPSDPPIRRAPPRRVLPEPTLFAGRGAPMRRASGSDAGPATRSAPPRPVVPSGPATVSADVVAMSLTAQELADSTGLELGDIAELERYGLLAPRSSGNLTVYDTDALVITRLAAAFRAHGLEPRHLRMFKVAADREASLFEQVVQPLARQRTAEARRAMHETVTDLSRLTDSLRSVLLQAALKSLD